jgi:hypothetical protein
MKSPEFRAATRCGADALRQCDGNATAMRRRCNRADGDATAQKPAQKPAENSDIILTRYRQNSDIILTRYRVIITDNIQTIYMKVQTCVYEYVSVPEIQTSYRLNTNTTLFMGESHTHSSKDMHILICLYVKQTSMYLIQTCMYDVCMCMNLFAHAYKISQLLLCLYVPKNTYKYKHAGFLMSSGQTAGSERDGHGWACTHPPGAADK